MSILQYAIFILLLSFFNQCTGSSKSRLEAEEAKQTIDSLRISTADSLLAQKKEKLDSIQQYYDKYDYQDGSLDRLIHKICKENVWDHSSSLEYSRKFEQCYKIDAFKANNHTLTYKTCDKRGVFWTELTLDGKKIIRTNLIPSNDYPNLDPEGFWTELKDLKMIKVRNTRYWEMRGITSGCVGSFCLWTHFLLYDLNRNQLYSFTAFSRGEAPNFMDLNEDGQIDFLELIYAYEGDHPQNLYGSNTLYIKAWTQNPQGKFELMKDSRGKVYQIKAHFDGELFHPRNTRILEIHWMNSVSFP